VKKLAKRSVSLLLAMALAFALAFPVTVFANTVSGFIDESNPVFEGPATIAHGQAIGFLDDGDPPGAVTFTVNVPEAGMYRLGLYAINLTEWFPSGSHLISINGGPNITHAYTEDMIWYISNLQEYVQLNAGNNTIRVQYAVGAVEIQRFYLTRVGEAAAAPTPAATPAASPTPAADPTPAAPAPTPAPPAEGVIVLRFVVGQTTYHRDTQALTIEAAPFNQDGRVMVPLRAVGEALGAEFAFENNVAYVRPPGMAEIRLPIGEALPGGMGTPVIVEGRTFVPLGFIAGEIGATPRWDGAANAAYIYVEA